MTTPMIIAIDGPAASGKSTVSKAVAAHEGLLYVDSGSVYRGVTWALIKAGCDVSDPDAVRLGLAAVEFRFFESEGAVSFCVNGQQPGASLRTEAINRGVSPVAAVPEVRTMVVDALRHMRELGGLVMEGRDIGTHVFPDATYKFYLDASPEERARRRHGETVSGGSLQDVQASIARRDTIDSTRKTHPLRVADDARIIDTTGLDVSGVVSVILGCLDPDGRTP